MHHPTPVGGGLALYGHATILNLLGLHHREPFFERSSLKEKLTGTLEPRVVKEILA